MYSSSLFISAAARQYRKRVSSWWRTFLGFGKNLGGSQPVWFGSSILFAFVLLGPDEFLTHWFHWDFLWGKILYSLSEAMTIWPSQRDIKRDIKSPLLQGLRELENLLNNSFEMLFPIYMYLFWMGSGVSWTSSEADAKEGGRWISSVAGLGSPLCVSSYTTKIGQVSDIAAWPLG